MPVRARSRSSISAITCLPERLIAFSSSSPASTPSRVKPPSRASAGGSSTSVASIASRTSARSSSPATSERTSGACRSARTVRTRGTTGERLLEADQIARARRAERGAGDQPLEILDGLQRVAQLAALGGPEGELLDRVEAIADRLERHQRAQQPGAQQPAADRGDRAIELVEQRAVAAALRSLEDLEVLERRRIDEERVGALAVRDGADVREVGLLRLAQVVDERAGRGDGRRPALEAEALQAAGAQLIEQRAARRFVVERPAVDRRDRQAGVDERRARLEHRGAGSRAVVSGRHDDLARLAARRSRRPAPAGRRRPGTRRRVNSPVDRSSSATPTRGGAARATAGAIAIRNAGSRASR